jgi:NAD(P)-dependent dehydrogenase (short-subunit alcohol dehydrogenase family)
VTRTRQRKDDGATKAALTILTVQYARALDGIVVNATDPGFTGTDGPAGTFQDRYGAVP